jgi:hypothetical protein
MLRLRLFQLDEYYDIDWTIDLVSNIGSFAVSVMFFWLGLGSSGDGSLPSWTIAWKLRVWFIVPCHSAPIIKVSKQISTHPYQLGNS